MSRVKKRRLEKEDDAPYKRRSNVVPPESIVAVEKNYAVPADLGSAVTQGLEWIKFFNLLGEVHESSLEKAAAMDDRLKLIHSDVLGAKFITSGLFNWLRGCVTRDGNLMVWVESERRIRMNRQIWAILQRCGAYSLITSHHWMHDVQLNEDIHLTPLHMSCGIGNNSPELSELLLQCPELDVNLKSRRTASNTEETPLIYCLRYANNSFGAFKNILTLRLLDIDLSPATRTQLAAKIDALEDKHSKFKVLWRTCLHWLDHTYYPAIAQHINTLLHPDLVPLTLAFLK